MSWLSALEMAGGYVRTPLCLVDGPSPNWDALAAAEGTLVVTPAAGALRDVCRALDEAACLGPFRLLLHPGRALQEARTIALGQPPVEPSNWLLVTGEAAGPSINEALPLYGCRVAVTREASQAGILSEKLRELGAEPVEFPVLSFHPPSDPDPLARALEQLESYDWVIFTSGNGVRFFLKALDAAGRDLRALGRARLAAIGPATASALSASHLQADLVPSSFVAESLVEAFLDYPLEGKRILLPRAERAREVLPEALRQRGAEVTVAAAYRTLPPPPASLEGVDWITFASSSSVSHFVALLGHVPPTPVLAIGPVTAASAREAGFERVEMASTYTLEGMVERLLEIGIAEPLRQSHRLGR